MIGFLAETDNIRLRLKAYDVDAKIRVVKRGEGTDYFENKGSDGQSESIPIDKNTVLVITVTETDSSTTIYTIDFQELEVLDKTFRDCPTCPEMVVMPAGQFAMGSSETYITIGEETYYLGSASQPQHSVTISNPFAVGKYEVTRGQYAAFVDETGHSTRDGCYEYTDDGRNYDNDLNWRSSGFSQSDNHPVVCVSWHDAQAYAGWLSKKANKKYRLLSEAEWEYMVRAGTTTPYHFGSTILPSQARYWHSGCGSISNSLCRGTVQVGSYPANAFGLHDMHGNVYEWVEDCWHSSYDGAPSDGSAWSYQCDYESFFVVRGGAWNNMLHRIHSAYRDYFQVPDQSIGFRVAHIPNYVKIISPLAGQTIQLINTDEDLVTNLPVVVDAYNPPVSATLKLDEGGNSIISIATSTMVLPDINDEGTRIARFAITPIGVGNTTVTIIVTDSLGIKDEIQFRVSVSQDIFVHNDNVVVMPIADDIRRETAFSGLDLAAYASDFYEHFEDSFDFLMFFSNLDSIYDHENAPYFGLYSSVRNDVEGIGLDKFYDNEYGSANTLKGVMHFPDNELLLYGPSLHELHHAWANYIVPTAVGGHWGFSSADGQLGGFDIANLVDLGGGQYTAGDFGTFANGGNSVPYSPIELYLAGFLAPEEVPDLWVAEDGSWLYEEGSFARVTTNGQPIFTASSTRTLTIEDIIATHGERVPSSEDAQRHFRVAVILLTDKNHPATPEQLDKLSEHVEIFSQRGGRGGNGVYSWATQGLGSVTMDGLSAFRKTSNDNIVGAMADTVLSLCHDSNTHHLLCDIADIAMDAVANIFEKELPESYGTIPPPHIKTVDGRYEQTDTHQHSHGSFGQRSGHTQGGLDAKNWLTALPASLRIVQPLHDANLDLSIDGATATTQVEVVVETDNRKVPITMTLQLDASGESIVSIPTRSITLAPNGTTRRIGKFTINAISVGSTTVAVVVTDSLGNSYSVKIRVSVKV